ncbi:PREDICTED: uncharacterized protein LOC108561857 [Nicrophorus vespilloides]|uniref:Uncharacterized protein LOC108561857 n=1 Tax=Nicrophorus vespilloides TaxID=110193 RepID=A0ABM1MLJ3_NICVS|nr:PREDICTED: uncharacterized protein LOC108561857 [Nicrophorus vespilloides]
MEESLILEVEKRPVLYDKGLITYKNSNTREEAWKEVAILLQLDTDTVKKRWRSLRDAFIRYHRAIKYTAGSKVGSKKKWVYYNYMLFLIPHIEFRESSIENEKEFEDDQSYLNEFQQMQEFQGNHEFTDTENSTRNTDTPSTFIEIQNKNHQKKRKREVAEDEKLLQIIGKEPHPDEQFLLSCLPIFKRLCPKKNQLARINIQKMLFENEFGYGNVQSGNQNRTVSQLSVNNSYTSSTENCYEDILDLYESSCSTKSTNKVEYNQNEIIDLNASQLITINDELTINEQINCCNEVTYEGDGTVYFLTESNENNVNITQQHTFEPSCNVSNDRHIEESENDAVTTHEMDVVHDIVCSLLETPYAQRNNIERQDILSFPRPVPALTILYKDRKLGQTFSRSFKTSWYDNHKWLCGSTFKNSLFCWPCLLLSNYKQTVWVTQGYSDLKNLSASVRKHERSKEHMQNFLSLKRMDKDALILANALKGDPAILLRFNEEVKKNRKLLSYLIDVTVTLVKQQLSFQDLDTSGSSNCNNFKELFNMLIKRDSDMQEHVLKIEATSTDVCQSIQNDLIQCIANYLIDIIHQEVKDALYYAVQVNDSADLLEKPQCALSLRFVNKLGELKERCLGFYDINEETTASNLYVIITNVLKPLHYEKKLVAQCYDGASIKKTCLDELVNEMKRDAPHAPITRLTLILQNGSNHIQNCRLFFATISSIPHFFHRCAKRNFFLTSVIQKCFPMVCESYWSSLSRVLHIVNTEWHQLHQVFSKIISDPSSSAESVNSSMNYLKHFSKIEFAFLTTVYCQIFSITDTLFNTLENKSLDVYLCQNLLTCVKIQIETLRTDSQLDDFIIIAQSKLSEEEIEHIDVERTTLASLYFEIVDNIISQIDTRFNDMGSMLYISLADSSKFKNYSDSFPMTLLNSLIEQFADIFDKPQLINELSVLYKDTLFHSLSIEQILRFFVENEFTEIFPEAYKLFVLICTIPGTSVSVEGQLSCLERIKAYSTKSMTERKSSSLSLLYVESKLLWEVYAKEDFLDQVITKFSKLKDQHINLIYKK